MNAPIILAIDSSTAFLRLAVQFGADRLVQSNEKVDRSHGQMIVRQISNILESSGTTVDRVGALVVCVGPGSFTGLRVGLAVAKGMAVALDIPIVGVSLFEVAAQSLGGRAGGTLAIIPHRRGEYFVAPIGTPITEASVRVVPETLLAELATQNRLVGLGFGDRTPQAIGDLPVAPMEYDASDLLHIGAHRLDSGATDSVEELEPLYFGKSQAEIKFDQRQAK